MSPDKASDVVLAEAPSRPNDPFSLIAVALERGLDPKDLYALAERWQAHQARIAFNTDFRAAQGEFPLIVKDRENPHTRSRYAALESVQRAILPVLNRHGFSLSFSTADSPLPEHVRIVGVLRHVGGHNETHHGDIPLDGRGSQGNRSAMNAPQATGSTYSYGQRYLTLLICGVTIANEDDDGGGQNGKATDDEVKTLQELLGKTRSNLTLFLEWAGVTKLEDIPRHRVAEALAMLKRKLPRTEAGS